MTTLAPTTAEDPNGSSHWTIAIFALMGLGLGLVLFAFRGPTYEAQTLVAVSNPAARLADEVEVVQSAAVIDIATLLLGFQPEISVTAAEVAGLLTITASDDDPQRAAAAANVVADTYVQAQQGAAANIAQPATVPTGASGLGPLVFAAIGTVLGAMLGLLAAPFRRRREANRPPAQAARAVNAEVRPSPPPGLLRDQPNEPRRQPGPPAQPGAARQPGPPAQPGALRRPGPPAQPGALRQPGQPGAARQPGPPAQPGAARQPGQPGAARQPGPPAQPGAARQPRQPGPARQPGPPAQPGAARHPGPPAQPGALRQPGPRQPPPRTTLTPPQDLRPLPAPTPQSPQQMTATPHDPLPQVADQQPQPEPITEMNPSSKSFSDASNKAKSDPPEPNWKADSTPEGLFDRRPIETELETTRYELMLAHSEELARLDLEHKRQQGELQAEVTSLTRQLREQAIRLKTRTGNDQTRTGDLEAQVDALEIELAGLRESLERERIRHTKKLTEERGSADRALDNARREYREELAKHLHAHRQAIADHQADLDRELAADRTAHAEALEQHHKNYETQLGVERQRAEATLQAANERHEREMVALRAADRNELERQAAQHKTTIEALRGSSESTDSAIRDLEKDNRLLRTEINRLQKQARHHEMEHNTALHQATDALAVSKTELEAERQRNSALRADVLRRSAESHQAIDRAVEERTAQLAELEASVTRQREYADTRVREVSAAADEQARQSAAREASLTASVSRLKRELAEFEKVQELNKP